VFTACISFIQIIRHLGVLIYIVALWASGVAQGIMNLSINDYGQLNYSFIDIVVVTIPYHWMRLAGGLMFLSGTLLMSYNLYKTYASSKHNLPVLVKIPKVHPGNVHIFCALMQ
jgi:cytochrome c oxidase cbb3-type subunit 1